MQYFIYFFCIKRLFFKYNIPKVNSQRFSFIIVNLKFVVKYLYLLSLLFFFVSPVYSQFGINLGYKFSEARTWQIAADNYITNGHRNILEVGTTGGLDFTFPTKSKFLVLQPNIQFTRLTSTLYHHQTLDIYNFDLFNFSFQFNLNFYLMQFNREQVAPGKRFGLAHRKRGIFLQLSPAIDHFRTEFTHPEIGVPSEPKVIVRSGAVDFSYSVGARLGFDLTWGRNLTLTPLVGFRYFPRVDWKDLTEIASQDIESGKYDYSSITQFSFGFRIGFDVK